MVLDHLVSTHEWAATTDNLIRVSAMIGVAPVEFHLLCLPAFQHAAHVASWEAWRTRERQRERELREAEDYRAYRLYLRNNAGPFTREARRAYEYFNHGEMIEADRPSRWEGIENWDDEPDYFASRLNVGFAMLREMA
jgi:hypothetical protein